MRLVVLLLAATAALAAQGAQAAACSNYTDCEACRADSNCAWTTHKDCSVSCVAIASFPADPLSTPWRTRISIAVNTTCASAETCERISGVSNPSFEDTTAVAWTQENSLGSMLICDASCSNGSSNPPTAFDGSRFVWLGGYTKNLTASFYQTIATISPEVTHLSFYLWVATLDTTSKTSVDVYIDSNLVFRLDKRNSGTFLKSYRVMEVDIRKYADGEQHTLKFKFQGQYITAGVAGTLMVDLVEFIKTPRMGDTDYKWPTLTTCSPGCPVSYSTDNECDTACNNAQCGFDNGKCESLLNGLTDVCYDTWKPAARTLPVCDWYSESTCCLSYATISYVEAQVRRARNSSSCNMEPQCLSNIEKLLCAKCSPNNVNYYADGILKVCMNYAQEAWKSCTHSYVPDGAGGCVAIDKRYTDAADWISQYGIYTFSSKECFGAQDTNSEDGTLSAPIIIAIVLGTVAIVAVAGAAGFAVWWFRTHKKKPPPPPLGTSVMMTQDPANQMTVMMVPDASMVPEPVVYTDQFGNIIPQEQLVAMTPVAMDVMPAQF